jgi:hypothetical protein
VGSIGRRRVVDVERALLPFHFFLEQVPVLGSCCGWSDAPLFFWASLATHFFQPPLVTSQLTAPLCTSPSFSPSNPSLSLHHPPTQPRCCCSTAEPHCIFHYASINFNTKASLTLSFSLSTLCCSLLLASAIPLRNLPVRCPLPACSAIVQRCVALRLRSTPHHLLSCGEASRMHPQKQCFRLRIQPR